MKLYEAPRNTRIRTSWGLELMFSRLDGMYSFCTTDAGEVVHLDATTEVEVVEKGDKE